MRTFLAVDLDKPLKKRIYQVIEELDSGERNVKWVRQEAMHITLKFLGEIDDIQKEEIDRTLAPRISRHTAFPLIIRGTGSFPPDSKKPRVFWIGIADGEPIIRLQQEIDDRLSNVGFAKEKRKFVPHLTLGRVKKTIYLQPIMDKLLHFRDELFGEMTVRKVLFFKSILKPSGAEYHILKEFELR
jgi:2'-5' RNA ligase